MKYAVLATTLRHANAVASRKPVAYCGASSVGKENEAMIAAAIQSQNGASELVLKSGGNVIRTDVAKCDLEAGAYGATLVSGEVRIKPPD